MHRNLVILNPTAGKGAASDRIEPWLAGMRTAGLHWDLAVTTGPGHARELAAAARAELRDVVVAAGGDGTANEVINGLMESGSGADDRPALGLLPIGRGNDFAHGALAPHDPRVFAELLARRRFTPLDVGIVEDMANPASRHFFGNGIGIGFDTLVGFTAARATMLHGSMAYFWGALVRMAAFPKAPTVKVAWESGELELRSIQVSIMNGRRMGGSFRMAPGADPGDGLLDLCAVQVRGRVHLFRMFLRFIDGTQAEDPGTRTARGSRFAITALEGTMPVHADGETIATAARELRVELLPSALRFVGLSGNSGS
ncbi:MAG: YegS/Rv2252/BmrU family lipid kinase [Spirochaetales bacterium]|nr:YegS/Rv2252/BmrU family lipid kinase [Spirochaetales bacterium]